jgi:hypothetical protein
MAKLEFKRKKLLVDGLVQGALLGRVVLYWLSCLVSMGLMLACWQVLASPGQPFYRQLDEVLLRYGPAVLASLLLLPMVLMDILRFSNRFAGPMVRMRRTLEAMARGEQVEPLRFRDADFWQELADQVNQVAERIKKLEPTPPAASQPEHPEEELVGAGT